MLESFFVILAVVSVACAYALYTGGRAGPATSNPFWIVISFAAVVLNLHVIGVLLPAFTIGAWAMVALLLGASLPAALREVKIWNAGLLQRPGNRELLMEVILIVTSIYAATVVDPQLPEVGRGLIIASIITPLLMVRWAITRIVITNRDRPDTRL